MSYDYKFDKNLVSKLTIAGFTPTRRYKFGIADERRRYNEKLRKDIYTVDLVEVIATLEGSGVHLNFTYKGKRFRVSMSARALFYHEPSRLEYIFCDKVRELVKDWEAGRMPKPDNKDLEAARWILDWEGTDDEEDEEDEEEGEYYEEDYDPRFQGNDGTLTLADI